VLQENADSNFDTVFSIEEPEKEEEKRMDKPNLRSSAIVLSSQ
jgi:hypothetical protein